MATDAAQAGRIEVLYGHSVPHEEPPPSVAPNEANTVVASSLERLLRVRSGWRSLRWDELVRESAVQRSHSDPAFLLTLDDGYRDNLTEALPILERSGVPVLIFVTTGFVDGTEEPAEHVLARIIGSCTRLRLSAGTLPCASIDEKRAAFGALKPGLKKKNPASRRRVLDSLATLNGVDIAPAEREFLTWDDVRRLDRHPLVTIGAHSRSHPLLTALSPLEAFAEIRGCKTDLESKLDRTVDCFAYPYGGHNALVRWLVARAGFKMAFATGQRPLVVGSKPNRLRIPRLDLKKIVAEMPPLAAQAT